MATAGDRRTRPPTPAVLLLALLLTSCGPANTAAPSPRSTPTSTSTSTGATTPAPSSTSPAVTIDDVSWDASGPSFGVDRAAWPDTPEGVRTLLASLPERLNGDRLELHIAPSDPAPVASYGDVDVVFVMTQEYQQGWPREVAAYQMLQGGFAMGALCVEDTHRGTVPVPVLPGTEKDLALEQPEPGVRNGSLPAWFSCRSRRGEEPGPVDWGPAVGWTSGKAAWLVYARDEQAARALITALHKAAR